MDIIVSEVTILLATLSTWGWGDSAKREYCRYKKGTALDTLNETMLIKSVIYSA